MKMICREAKNLGCKQEICSHAIPHKENDLCYSKRCQKTLQYVHSDLDTTCKLFIETIDGIDEVIE